MPTSKGPRFDTLILAVGYDLTVTTERERVRLTVVAPAVE